MRIERRQNQPKALLIVAPVLAVLAALSLEGILIALAGVPVLAAYKSLFVGAFGSKFAITETLTRATPLIVTGLAAAVAWPAGSCDESPRHLVTENLDPSRVMPAELRDVVDPLPYWFVIGGNAVRCLVPYRPTRDVDFGVR